MAQFPIALQLYSIREDAEKDLRGALSAVRDMGYDGVELAGLYGYSPDEFRNALSEFGLTAISAHVPYQDILADMEGTINQYITIGCKYIVIPYLTEEYRPGTGQFEGVVENIKKIGAFCKQKGVTLLYHNHDFEFHKMDDGRYALDYLYETVGADILETEIDTCWVHVSGVDPVEYLKKYKGRSPVVHLKDYVGEKSANMYELIGIDKEEGEKAGTFQFRAVGYGVQDIRAILAASAEAGAQWLVVEQDMHYEYSAMEDSKRSLDYLKTL